ncbi:hypothetical protein FOZ62_010102, partial [Perkinsus olseni]
SAAQDPEIMEEMKAYKETAERGSEVTCRSWQGRVSRALHALGECKTQLAIVIMVQVLQQLSGNNAFIFYQTTIFQAADIDSKDAMALAVMAVMVGVTLIGCVVIDRLGRRVLLVTSAGGMCIAAVLLGTFFFLDDVNHNNVSWLAIFSAFLYIGSFSIGVGAIPWLIIAEIAPNE